MRRDLLPVGTVVRVNPYPATGERPYRAIVRGYDMHGSKYRLGPELYEGSGEFLDGFRWAFPSEVKEDT